MITFFFPRHTLGLYGLHTEHTHMHLSTSPQYTEQQRKIHTLADASVCAAEATSLLAVPVEPHAENHEDQPAGGANARNKSRLPHDI